MQNPHAEYAGTIQSLVRALVIAEKTGEPLSDVADRLRLPAPAARILKAAVAAASLADPQWASGLADMAAASSAFLQGLGGRSAFALLLDTGILTKAPLRSRVTAAAEAVVGEVSGEGKATAVSKMSLSGDILAPRRAEATIVLSREIIENASASSQAFVSRQLRRAVARALDAGFVDSLISSSTPTFISTGDHIVDLKILLGAVNSGWGRLALIAATDVANSVSLLNDGKGSAAPEGASEFLNLPFCVSPALASGTLLLIDGDRVAADIEGLGVDISRYAAIEMDTTPANDAGAPTPTSLVSLWQSNAAAIRLSALFGAVAGTPDAVALMANIEWPPVVSG